MKAIGMVARLDHVRPHAPKMILTFLATMAFAVCILIPANNAEAVELGTPSNLTSAPELQGSQVYLGSYNGANKLWHVMKTDGNTATLWLTDSLGDPRYDPVSHNDWSGSQVCAYLNGFGAYVDASFVGTAFHTVENEALAPYQTVPENGLSGNSYIPNQKVVLPSVEEIGAGDTAGTWNVSRDCRIDGDFGFQLSWWLRSPGEDTSKAAYVDQYGYTYSQGDAVTNLRSLYPVVKLDFSSVFFTSAGSASGGKNSVTFGDGFSRVTAPASSTPVKLTLFNSDTSEVSLASAQIDRSTVGAGSQVELSFSGARIDAGQYVSALLVDSEGEVLYYAKLSENKESGTVSFAMPPESNLPPGDYTLRVFNEWTNPDDMSDFASTPLDIPLTVDNTKPTVVAIEPSGTTEDATGTLSITFSREMSTAPGTVSLDNGVGALTGGSWKSATVYEIPYTDLKYSTEYAITVSGFMDAVGNVMEADSSHTFTTKSQASSVKKLADTSDGAPILPMVFTVALAALTLFVARREESLHK